MSNLLKALFAWWQGKAVFPSTCVASLCLGLMK